ncbi:helix-turn-helix transcriptional regulator [Micromonospora polyrhachis]|uniref:Transcriptional regulator with XRE-family HTH domain n=1 Tax=Micromonospora polyrhachis TaxID=1282883 RepID=A0A7W7SQW4_9ACTN|nr:helix-turn-helix transcriptional regulator [Micromonospora polyrhachis]MBB4959317.1 transcriptional regulator with XRE-family HTH domain [Micromonospora polyrhachis]
MESEVGQRILALRTARGLTQRALAEPRYTAAYISSVERGRRIPSTDALSHFAERLGIPLVELATGEPATSTIVLDLELAEADALALTLASTLAEPRAGIDPDRAPAEHQQAATEHQQMATEYRRVVAAYQRVAEAATDDPLRAARCQLGLGRLALTLALALALASRTSQNTEPASTADEQVERASGYFDAAWRLLADGDPRLRAEAVAEQAACARLRGAAGYGAYLLSTQRDELHRTGYPDPAALLALHAQLAACQADRGDEEAAIEAAEAALALAGPPDPDTAADLHLTVARTLLAAGRSECAATALDQARRARAQAMLRPELARCHHIRGRARLVDADVAGAAADLLAAHRDYTATGQLDAALDTGVDLAQVHRALGRPAQARALLDAALAATDPTTIDAVNPVPLAGGRTAAPDPTPPHPLRAARAYRVLALLATDDGDQAGAERCLRTAIELYRRIGPRRELAQATVALADLFSAGGDATAAARVLHDGLTGIEQLTDRNGYG